MPDATINSFLLLAQQVTAFLESPYKPFLIFAPFVPWAWLISSKLDKDARYYHINHQLWNGIHLLAGVVGLGAMLFVPIFWIGWPVGAGVLLVPILIYWRYRNQQVPAGQRFSLTGQSMHERLDARKRARATHDAMIQFVDAGGRSRQVPSKEDALFSVHMLAEDLVAPALDARASMIEIVVGEGASAVTQTIDGYKYKREPVPPDAGVRLIDYIKEIAGMDLEDRRRRQTAEFKMSGPSGSTQLAATTAGSSDRLVLRLEFDRPKRLSRPFDNLGLLPSQMERLALFAEGHERHGLIFVGAPPANGLTTTMYSLLARHDAYTCNIKTLEREILLRLDGVDHVRWDPTNPDLDYATQLQSILRRDPDIVMIDSVRDTETARTASEPGMQGPLIYVPQRQPSIAEQIREWVKLVGDTKQATRAMRAVANQRLVRTLCPNCKQSYQPNAEQLKRLNLPAGKVTQLFRAGGKVQVKNKIESCPICGGTGYFGQTGVFEVMVIDDEARRLLASNDAKAALAHARRNKMIYLQEAALSKVASGETSIEEVARITAPKVQAAQPA